MIIKDARRLNQEPSRKGFRTLVRFNLEPIDGVLIYDCSLVEAPDGRIFLYGPPSRTSSHVVSFSPDVRRHVIATVIDTIGMEQHDRSAA